MVRVMVGAGGIDHAAARAARHAITAAARRDVWGAHERSGQYARVVLAPARGGHMPLAGSIVR